MHFQPGQSGNPSGRPAGSRNRVSEFREAIEGAVTPEEITAVARKLLSLAIAGDTQAARVLLDRVLGKPTVSLEVTEAVDPVVLRLREAMEARRRSIADN
jgi:Family of unknown function (DUF5681)